MKRFITSVAILLASLPGMACGSWGPDYDVEFFCVCGEEGTFAQETRDRQLAALWSQYVGRTVTVEQSAELASLTLQDLNTTRNPIVRKARTDAEMMAYLRLLVQYLGCIPDPDAWEYPTEAELRRNRSVMLTVQTRAAAYRGTRLAARYRLLRMRLALRLDQPRQAVALWTACPAAQRSGVLGSMMRGYYAAALVRLNQTQKACAEFAAMGDYESARYLTRTHTNSATIRNIYQNNRNSEILPFMIQDFVRSVGYSQNFVDDDSPLSDESTRDMNNFLNLASEVVSHGQVQNPQMWQSAAAMMQYYLGHYAEAATLARSATTMHGTPLMKQNARFVAFLCAAKADPLGPQYEQNVIRELEWMRQQHTDYWDSNVRLVIQEALQSRFRGTDREFALDAISDLSYRSMYADDNTDEFYMISSLDAAPIPRVLFYYNYLFGDHKGQTALDEYLRAHTYTDRAYFDDELATRYIRAGQFQRALEYARRVPLSYLNRTGVAPYMYHYKYTDMPGKRNAYIPYNTIYGWDRTSQPLTVNPRVQYCQDVLNAQSAYQLSTGVERQRCAVRLAGYYTQASEYGRCWWLTQYGNSSYHYSDPEEEEGNDDDFDFLHEGYHLYAEATQSTDVQLRQQALYVRAWISQSIYDSYYTDREDILKTLSDLDHDHRLWTDLAALHRFTQSVPSSSLQPYVSRCAVLQCFRTLVR